MSYAFPGSAQVKKEGGLNSEITEEVFAQIIAEVSEKYNAVEPVVLDTLNLNKRVTFADAFIVNTKGAIHHPIGQVEMKVELAYIDQAMHYNFSGFLFHPYKRNRYGRYVEANLKPSSFDFPAVSANDKQKAIQKATGAQITGFIEMLQKYLPESK